VSGPQVALDLGGLIVSFLVVIAGAVALLGILRKIG
jgi:hypothetical protein